MARYPAIRRCSVSFIHGEDWFVEFPVIRGARRQLPGREVDLFGEAIRLACVEAVVHQEAL